MKNGQKFTILMEIYFQNQPTLYVLDVMALVNLRKIGANRMKEHDKDILRKFCLYFAAEFNCKPCSTCPLYGVLWCNNKIYDKGWTLQQALRCFARTSIPQDEARKILEEKMGMPLDIVQMLLREIKDYEDCPDV